MVEVVGPDGLVTPYLIRDESPAPGEVRAWVVTSPDWSPAEPEKGRYRVSAYPGPRRDDREPDRVRVDGSGHWYGCGCNDFKYRNRPTRTHKGLCKHGAAVVESLTGTEAAGAVGPT